MARTVYTIRSFSVGILDALVVPLRIVVHILVTPLALLAGAVLAVFNTITFCLVSPIRLHLNLLQAQSKHARSYEEWRSLQLRLDNAHNVRSWSQQDEDLAYDWRALRSFRDNLELSRQNNNVIAMQGNLRAQATRNPCSMLSLPLFMRSQIQTKRLIHEYNYEMRRCVEYLERSQWPPGPALARTDEDKRRLFSDVRQILGRTTLVLQGGAMISMCHLGVVKALHRRRLLPRIITATGTGALVASIVACTPDERLLSALEGSSINIDAFIDAREQRLDADAGSYPFASWVRAIVRRTRRFCYTGHFFEIGTLTQCVRDNIGDLTFEEAYVKSGRILNITIAKADVEGTPQLLNYITAPHVVVWSAVAASVATSKSMFAATTLKCKNDVGMIVQYFAVDSPSSSTHQPPAASSRIPMERIGELFNVNHYIVSQTRPYIIPLIRLRNFMYQDPILGAFIKVLYCELLHRLDTLIHLGMVPTFIQRIRIDELVPSTSSWSKFVITPDLSFFDYTRIFNFPSPTVINTWAMKGERSVWPKVCQIKLRCSVEFEIDAAYLRDTGGPRRHGTQPHPTVNGHDR